MDKVKSNLTPAPNLSDHAEGTGAVRKAKPYYQDLMPPCNHACPAGENIQAWVALGQAGEKKQTWEKLIESNPMPAIHGRVCYHPCEESCNRSFVDHAVSIHAVERFLGDLAIEKKMGYSNSIRIIRKASIDNWRRAQRSFRCISFATAWSYGGDL